MCRPVRPAMHQHGQARPRLATAHLGRRAFSLLEAAVVMFLIGIAALTVTAAFGGQRSESQDRIAQTDIDAALDATNAIAAIDGLVSADLTRLGAEAPELVFKAANEQPAGPGEVSVAVSSVDSIVGVAARTADGTCWYARHNLEARSSQRVRIFAVAAPGATQPCTGNLAANLDVFSGESAAGGTWRAPLALSDQYAPTTAVSPTPPTLPPVSTIAPGSTSSTTTPPATTSVTTVPVPSTTPVGSPPTPPGAPTGVTATIVPAAPTTAEITWVPPTSAGSAPVTGYAVSCTATGGAPVSGTAVASPVTLSSFSAGYSYTCSVRALNAVGYGEWSAPSAAFVPYNLPSTPTGFALAPADSSIIASWTPLVSSVASPVSGYRVYRGGVLACQVVGADARTCVVAGLTNGTTYSLQLTAYHLSSESTPTAPLSATPSGAPGAPTIGAAVPGVSAGSPSVDVAFTAPASSGGSPITTYTVTCRSSNGGEPAAATGTTGPLTVLPLTAGRTYTCEVAAANAAGNGPMSAPTAPFDAVNTPSAPTDVVGTAEGSTISVAFTPGAANGAEITAFRATCSPEVGNPLIATASSSPISLPNGTAGTSYTCTVAGRNILGWGEESTPSAPVVPFSAPTTPPVGLAVTPANAALDVTWVPLVSTTANPVVGYRVYVDGVVRCTLTDATIDSCQATGLANGVTYPVFITAYNSAGESPPSATVYGTPIGLPGVPSGLVAVLAGDGAGRVSVFFIAPANDGGAPVTDYDVQWSANGGVSWTSFTDGTSALPSVTVSGLVDGTEYVFRVRARNASGPGEWSEPSNTVIASDVPGAVTNVVAAPGANQVRTTWTPATSQTHAPITGHEVQYRTDGGSWSPIVPLDTSSSDPEYLIDGLTNGTAYEVRVRAYNAAGPGPWAQSTGTATPYALPTMGVLTLTPGDTELVATWSRPSGTFDGYRVYVGLSGSPLDELGCQADTAETLTCTITGLTNGQAYDAAVSVYRFGTDGEAGPTATATPVGPPATPTGFSVSAGSSNVAASWSPVSSTPAAPVTGYRVYYASGTATPTLGCTAVGSTSCTVNGLTAGVLYGLQVTAYGPGGESAPSPVEYATPSGVSDAPSISAITAGNAQVDVSWTPSPTPSGPVTGYVVLRDGTTGCTTADAATTTCSVTGLTNGTLYSFQVYALYASSPSLVSSVVQATPVQPATVSYPAATFDPLRNDQSYSPTTSGFAASPTFSLTGATPVGVGFSTADGVVRGPATWAGRTAALSNGVSRAHTCFVTTAGAVKCWGANGSSQLGDGTSRNQATPRDTYVSSGASAVTVSQFSTCVLTTAGGVRCWGSNWEGEYGNGTTSSPASPQDVTGLSSGVTRISGQLYTLCAVHTGSVKCWGSNTNGVLGNGSAVTRSTTPVTVTGITDAVDVSVGYNFACALSTSTGVSCWGANDYGQLGNGTTTASSTPVTVSGLANGVVAVSAGTHHACALLGTGAVRCWGSNDSGRLGDGSSTNRTTPVAVIGLADAAQLSVGSAHTCATTTSGAARCWGYNLNGRLGDGSSTNRSAPVTVSGLATGVRSVAAAGSHTCALTTSATVRCWGLNAEGQLGVGWADHATSPGAVPGLSSIVKATVGYGHTCALNTLGGVRCWGLNANGALGAGNVGSQQSTPQQVVGLASGVSDLTSNLSSTCALTTAGGVKCWGTGSSGQLGNGSSVSSNTPVDVTGLTSGVAQVVTGMSFACARTAAGGVKCWGANFYGQLGDGTTTERTTPVDVTGLTSGVTQITAGTYHACALLSSGTARCWGLNQSGALGGTGLSITHPASIYTTPQNVTQITSNIASIDAGSSSTCTVNTSGALRCWGDNIYGQSNYASLSSGVASVASGSSSRCVRMTDSSVRCWGANYSGQLGDLTNVNRTTPVTPEGLGLNVTALSAGVDEGRCAVMVDGTLRCWGESYYGEAGHSYNPQSLTPVEQPLSSESVVQSVAGAAHTCVLLSTTGVRCWGANADGQLGDGTTTPSTTGVTPFGLSSGVRQLTAGSHHTCAAMITGGTKCWGRNTSGQLGDNSTTRRTTPVDVSGLTTQVARIAAGGSHTCAVLTSTGVRCWGANTNGQLGNASTTQSATAVTPTGLATGAVQVAAGGSHTCVTTLTATVRCWGANTSGQLGDGTTTQRTTAVDVDGVTDAVQLAAGAAHTCARTSSTVRCFGENSSGQLGDGTTTDRSTAVAIGGISAATSLAAGADTTCVVSTGTAPRCVGSLVTDTTGTTVTTMSATSIDGFFGVTAVGAGPASVHMCATTTGGMLGCFGQNGDAQLGDTTTTARPTAVWASGLVTNTGFPSTATITAADVTSSATGQISFALGASPVSNPGTTTTTSPAGSTTTTAAPTTTAPAGTTTTTVPAGTTTTTTVPAAPGAPTGVAAATQLVAGSATSASVSFSAPASAGSSAITAYRATCTSSNGGTTRTQTGASSPITVSSLTAGKTYTCTAAAQNAAGWSSESSASAAIAPYTTPDAPSDVAATAGVNGVAEISVAFIAPANDGGSAVTSYEAVCTSSNGGTGGSATGGSSPVTVTGLDAGKTYTCVVTASNNAGPGATSPASDPVVPFTTPDAPTGVATSLVAGTPTSVSVAFTAPANDGGSAITYYDAACSSATGAPSTMTGASSPLVITGLTAGATYTCVVAAVNAAGPGPDSTPSAAFVPYNIPGTPSGLAATPGNTQVTLSWNAMSSTASDPVAGYRVYLAGGTLGCLAAGAATTSCTVTGLTNGTSYSFQVLAYYDSTEGVLSAAVATTPRTVPGAPVNTSASVDSNGLLSYAFTAPTSDGGAAITGYTLTCTAPGQPTRTGTSSGGPFTVSGLLGGVTYTCSATAENAAGSSASSATRSVTSSLSYSCPAGGSLSGSTCTQTVYNYGWTCPSGGTLSGSWCANGYTASDSYGAALSCWGPSLDSTTGTNWNSSYSYPRTVNVGGYNACGGHIGYNNHRTQYASNGTPGCWLSIASATAFSTSNMVGCRSDRFVNIRYYRGGGHSYSCPSGGSLSGSTCYRSWWVDTSYSATWAHVSTSYPTYAATGTWNYSVT